MKRTIALIIAVLLLSVPASAMKLIYGTTLEVVQVNDKPTQYVPGITTGMTFKATGIKDGEFHVYVSGKYAENNEAFTKKYGTEGQGILFVRPLNEKRGGNLFLLIGGTYDWMKMTTIPEMTKLWSLTFGAGYRYAFDEKFIGWIAVQDYGTLGIVDKDNDFNALRIGLGVGIGL